MANQAKTPWMFIGNGSDRGRVMMNLSEVAAVDDYNDGSDHVGFPLRFFSRGVAKPYVVNFSTSEDRENALESLKKHFGLDQGNA